MFYRIGSFVLLLVWLHAWFFSWGILIFVSIMENVIREKNLCIVGRAKRIEFKNLRTDRRFFVNSFPKCNTRRSMEKFVGKISSSPYRFFNDCERNFIKRRGFEATAERRHTPISRFHNDANQGFLSRLTPLLRVSVCVLFPPLPPSFHVPPFLSSAKKGVGQAENYGRMFDSTV